MKIEATVSHLMVALYPGVHDFSWSPNNQKVKKFRTRGLNPAHQGESLVS